MKLKTKTKSLNGDFYGKEKQQGEDGEREAWLCWGEGATNCLKTEKLKAVKKTRRRNVGKLPTNNSNNNKFRAGRQFSLSLAKHTHTHTH